MDDSAAVEAEDMISADHNDIDDTVLRPNIRCVVIDCSSMMFVDSVGVTVIQQVATVTDFLLH